MCDYSLVALRNRLAVEGEELITFRFPTGSLGLTTPTELGTCNKESRGWRTWLDSREVPCAVCIPPGSRLLLQDIPERLQQQLGVGAAEEVVFTQNSAEAFRHRDGVRFRNGQEILLQRLAEAQRTRVLSLSAEALSEQEAAAEGETRAALV
jgi:hypothetical protein